MKKILLMLGVATLALTSCSQDEVVNVNKNNGTDKAITFRVRSHKSSRAQEFSTYNLEDFMVYGYKGCPDDEEEVVAYFEDGKPVKFTRGEDMLFTSSIPYYYPVDGSWLYFAAYAPSTLNVVPSDNYGGVKIENYTVNSDINKQEDLIFASGGSNLLPDEPDQELSFLHVLTKVFISKVSNSDSRYKYEIVGLKFGNIHNSGEYIFRGEKAIFVDEDSENGKFRPDGYIQDATGYGIFWKPLGEQTGDMTYMLSEPVVLDKDETTANLMSGDDTESTGDEAHECFMLIPQQLSSAFVNEDGEFDDNEFKSGMSYIAFLVRITYLPTGDVIYPYAEGVEDITETVEGVDYAWAAFPIPTLWVPGKYVDYYVDFSKGAGFVAPGASDEYALQPILGREIKFGVVVEEWAEGTEATRDHNNYVSQDVTTVEDPFADFD